MATEVGPSEGERAELRGQIAELEEELAAAVAAPVKGSRDVTECLPDELMEEILLLLWVQVWDGTCGAVCQRWARLVRTPAVAQRARDWRWDGYARGLLRPRELVGHTEGTDASRYWYVDALAVAPDGTAYSGSGDRTVRA
jgi:hypothetical protein